MVARVEDVASLEVVVYTPPQERKKGISRGSGGAKGDGRERTSDVDNGDLALFGIGASLAHLLRKAVPVNILV